MRCRICGQEVAAPGYCMTCGTYYEGDSNQGTVIEGQVEGVASTATVSAGAEQATVSSDYSLVPYVSQQAGSYYQGYAAGNGMNGYPPQGGYYPQQNGMYNYSQQNGYAYYQPSGGDGFFQQNGIYGYQQQNGIYGYQQQTGVNGYQQQGRYGYINHSRRKRNVIIGVIAAVVLLTMVILIVALPGSAGASSPEEAISDYINACATGDADALLNAMLPSNLQRQLTDKQKKNLKEEMEFCNAEIRDLESSYSSSISQEKIVDYQEALFEGLKIYDSEFEIDRVIIYSAQFEVKGDMYRPYSSLLEGRIKNYTKWDSATYKMYCYKTDGKWYCMSLF